MATVHLSPVGNGFQFLSANVIPALALGKIYTYGAGTTTPQDTYTTSAGNVKNSNPITLNSDGRCPQEIWLVEGFNYRFDLTDALGNLIQTLDNLYGINDLTNAGQLPGSNVTFLQAGSGAVLTTIQTKARQAVSVFDFMTAAQIADVQSGSLTLDVTTPIQNALTDYYDVDLPPGNYKTTTALTLKAGQTVKGRGMGVSTITGSAAQIFDYEPGGLTTGKMTIADMTLVGASASVLSGIKLKNLALVQIRNVEFSGMTDAAAKPIHFVGNVLDYTIEQNYIHNCGGDHIFLGLTGGTCNNGNLRRNQFNAETAVNTCITVSAGTQNVVINCANNFEGNPNGISIAVQASGTTATVIAGNYFEGIQGACVVANTGIARNLVVQSNHFATSNAAAADIILNSAGPNDGATIQDNYFAILGNPGAAPIGVILGLTTNYSVRRNTAPQSTPGVTTYVSIAGVSKTTFDWDSTLAIFTMNGFGFNQVDGSILFADGHRWISSTGVPNLPFATNPVVNDEYFQKDGVPLITNPAAGRLWRCTVGGGAPTWIAYA